MLLSAKSSSRKQTKQHQDRIKGVHPKVVTEKYEYVESVNMNENKDAETRSAL